MKLGNLITLLWAAISASALMTDVAQGQQVYNVDRLASDLSTEVDATWKVWPSDASKLTGIGVVITESERDGFKERYIGKARTFLRDRKRAVTLGQKFVSPDTVSLLRATGFFERMALTEDEFWYRQGSRSAVLLTTETVRNIFYAVLLSAIRDNPSAKKLEVPIRKYSQYEECPDPPYTKWYCH